MLSSIEQRAVFSEPLQGRGEPTEAAPHDGRAEAKYSQDKGIWVLGVGDGVPTQTEAELWTEVGWMVFAVAN